MHSLIMNKIQLFFLLSLLIQSTIFAAAADIVAHTCKQIAAGNPELNYDLCLSLFNSTPRSHSANLKGLATISINFTQQNAQHVLSDIKTLIKQQTDSNFKKNCLKTCESIYVDAVSNLKDAAKAIEDGRINDARTVLSASFDVADTCEDCFTDGNIQSPLTKDDDYYVSMARIPLAIAALLDN